MPKIQSELSGIDGEEIMEDCMFFVSPNQKQEKAEWLDGK